MLRKHNRRLPCNQAPNNHLPTQLISLNTKKCPEKMEYTVKWLFTDTSGRVTPRPTSQRPCPKSATGTSRRHRRGSRFVVTVFRQREATEATVPIRRSRRRLGETPDETAPEVGRTINIPSSYSTTKSQELKHELLTRNIALLSTFSMEITILARLRSLDDQTASVDNGRIVTTIA